VNQVHPPAGPPAGPGAAWREGIELLGTLAERDRRGVAALRALLPGGTVAEMPLLPEAPTGLPALAALGDRLAAALAAR
jgi:hypothetical protein